MATKVKISFTLDIDVDAWATYYDIDASEVREDVKRYVTNGISSDFAAKGLLAIVPGEY